MKKKKSKTKFGNRGATRETADQEKSKGLFGITLPQGVDKFEVRKGKVFFEIIPFIISKKHPDARNKSLPVKGDDYWYRMPYKNHSNIGNEELSYICPTTIGKPCPICEYRSAQMKKEDADKEEIKALRPKDRMLYNVLPQDSDEIEIFEISKYAFQDKLNEEIREGEEEWADFWLPEDGFTLKVRFTEDTGGGFKFIRASRIDFKQRTLDEEVLEKAINLEEILDILDYKELEKIFMGVDIEDEDEDSEKSTTTRKHKGKKEEEEEEPECFGTEFDDYEDCEECKFAEDCEKKMKKGKSTKKTKGKKDKGKCPHDYKFGEDWEIYDECDDCEESKACEKASD